MPAFEARKRRYQLSASKARQQVNARRRGPLTFDAVAPPEVQEAVGAVLVDDFESGGLTAYTGDTSLFTVDGNAPVPHGAYSLKTAAGIGAGSIVSTSGLDNYLDQGETMAVQLHPIQGNSSRMGTLFFVQDVNNLYMLNVLVDKNNVDLHKRVGGSWTKHASDASVNLSQGTEYRTEVTPQTDGILVCEVYEESSGTKLTSISATETTYTDGGNGWRIASGANGSDGDAFDFARLV